tara:strand:+ start:5533 stop:7269 length:1737 start_codon:yes stop_codon:yes gene_type:complete
MTPDQILDRAIYLRQMHKDALPDRYRFKAILNGGEEGITELLGTKSDSNNLPAPNLMLSALDRLAQKIGKTPTTEVQITNARDSGRNRKKKEKIERIVNSYDNLQKLELQLPQVARWLPGYGFAVWVISTKEDSNGNVYPIAELRNPYDCYPGHMGNTQDPQELAIVTKIPIKELLKMYPELKSWYNSDKKAKQRESQPAALYGLNEHKADWSNSGDDGDIIIEYMNPEGTYIVHIASKKIVDFIPNVLKSGPAFVVAKRFSFDKLQGQFDQVVGLMAAMAKINILSVIAMEDAVFTETNIVGEIESGKYRKGRHSINYLTPGSQVVKPVTNLPYQLFESVGRLERQLRVVAGYPVQDDAISPNSFVTGRGLEELESGVSQMVTEYHTILEYALQEVDTKRLELDEILLGNKRKPMTGTYKGASFAEFYTPDRDIDSNYVTKRKYGAMASFDAPNKIITGLQLLQAGIIDKETMQAEMDGLDNLTQINERITKQKTEEILFQMLLQQGQQGDTSAMMAVVEIYNNPKKIGNILEKFFSAAGEQPSPEEQAMMMAQQAGAVGPAGPQGPPNLAAMLGGG